jgi:cell division protein FtsA|tara:strand:- start:9650 stop:10921 length:1272 start_codon:yes stop_codon:yes gene_type:complete
MEENTSKIAVGLDIGTTKITVIVGRKNEHGKIEILGMGKAPSTGVMRGIVANIDKTTQSINKALDEAITSSGLQVKNVNVGIAGQHIKSLQHRGQLVRENLETEINDADIDKLMQNMYKLVMVPGEEIIHVIPQEYIVDKQDNFPDPRGMVGVQLEANFHIITGQTAAISNIKKCVNNASLAMTGLTLEPLASATSVLDHQEIEAGVALVDIGGGTTDVAIFKDGIIRHTAVIPFGGNIITQDIKEGCSILENQAELLKIKFGSALASQNKENEIVSIPGLRGRDPKEISLKNLANIIQARVEEIIELVHHEIKNSGYESKLITGIVLTGGGSQLKHIGQLVEFHTGIECRIGYPNEHISSTSPVDVSSPMYATGVGLVMKFLEEENGDELSAAQKGSASNAGLGDFFKKMLDKIDKYLTNDE